MGAPARQRCKRNLKISRWFRRQASILTYAVRSPSGYPARLPPPSSHVPNAHRAFGWHHRFIRISYGKIGVDSQVSRRDIIGSGHL